MDEERVRVQASPSERAVRVRGPRTRIGTIVLLLALAASGCATSRPEVLPPASPAAPVIPWRARPFPTGERLVYRARVAGIDAARATLSVGQAQEEAGRELLPLRITVEGYEWLTRFYPLKIKFISWVDPPTLQPRRMERSGANGSVSRQVSLDFLPRGRVRVDFQNEGGKKRTWQRIAREGAYDYVSGLYEIRAWLLGTETSREMAVFDGIWNRAVQITRGGIEEVWTPAGWFKARRFEVVAERIRVPGDKGGPKFAPRIEKFSAWVTDDDLLVPVRLLGETPVGNAEVLLESRSVRPPAEEGGGGGPITSAPTPGG
ncbi:MAG: DUF3108 domain-containing protein [Myxococcota bacterium]|jgi:hypothetical protein|nr:DUF3108 domain-containing protein [Myxococcota bacterium]